MSRSLVVEVEEELVVETLDILERGDNLLKVLVLGSSIDGVVNLKDGKRKGKEEREVSSSSTSHSLPSSSLDID